MPGQISMKSTQMEKHRAFAASQPVKLTHATSPRTSLWTRFLDVPGWTLDIFGPLDSAGRIASRHKQRIIEEFEETSEQYLWMSMA